MHHTVGVQVTADCPKTFDDVLFEDCTFEVTSNPTMGGYSYFTGPHLELKALKQANNFTMDNVIVQRTVPIAWPHMYQQMKVQNFTNVSLENGTTFDGPSSVSAPGCTGCSVASIRNNSNGGVKNFFMQDSEVRQQD